MTRSARLVVTLAVNAALVVGQFVAGLAAHSTGLVADAAHNLTDVAAVCLSLLAVRWALRPRSDTRSFGNHRGTILAALANAAGLAVLTGAIVAASIVRLVHPAAVDAPVVVAVASIAIVANAVSALVLLGDRHDLNMRATFLHMAADVMASACVLVAGVVIMASGGGWDRLDPAAALVVGILIGVQAVRLVKQSIDVLLESTPSDLDLMALRRAITDVPGVGEVHDLHVWSLSSEVRALSAHLVLTGHPTLEEAQQVGGRVRSTVSGPFEIAHTTFELECERCTDEEADPCGMDELAGSQPVGADSPGD